MTVPPKLRKLVAKWERARAMYRDTVGNSDPLDDRELLWECRVRAAAHEIAEAVKAEIEREDKRKGKR